MRVDDTAWEDRDIEPIGMGELCRSITSQVQRGVEALNGS